MTSALKKAAGNILSSAELYRKLTRAQRICFWLVLGVLGLSSLFVLSSGGPAAGVSSAGQPAASPASGQDEAEDSTAGWPFGSSILEPPGRFEARLHEVNRRRIEQAILLNSKVETATVLHYQARSPKHASASGSGGTAAVVVKLKAGALPLNRSEAEAIRSTVSCGLNLEPADVTLTDSEYRSYLGGSSQGLPADVGEAEERRRREIKDSVSEYCSRFFKPSEYHVAVIVYLSPEQTSVEKKEVDPAKSISKPTRSEWEREETRGDEEVAGGMISPRESHRTVVRETTEEKPWVSWEKRLTKIPPGALKGVGVIVSLDLGAVKGILSRDSRLTENIAASGPTGSAPDADSLPPGELDERLSAYLFEQEEALTSLLRPLEGLSVRVVAQPFSSSSMAGGAASASALEPALLAAGEAPVLPANPWKKAVLLGAAILAILALMAGIFRVARRRPAPVPGAGAPRLAGGSRPGRASEWVSRDRFREALASFHRSLGEVSSTGGPQETLLKAVSETAGKVRSRPDLAASVLRIWLAQDAGALRERTVRS